MKSYSTSVTKVIRVPIADDHPVFREGLVTILKSENDIKVVAEATDGEFAVAAELTILARHGATTCSS